MSTAVLQAAKVVPLTVLKRFRAVICEDSSKIPLPNELTGLRPGDEVSFRILVTEKEGWIDRITKLSSANVAEAPPRETK